MALSVKVYTNADDTFVVWHPEAFIPNCRGFALYRRVGDEVKVVNTWVGFEGQDHKEGEFRPSTEWPIQKLMWTDYLAQRGEAVAYRVVPMVGQDKAHLVPDEANASDWTGITDVSPDAGNGISAYFNRGIVASQWVARRLSKNGEDTPSMQRELSKGIETPGSRLREELGGLLREQLLALLAKANEEKRKVYAALYELDDPELEEALLAFRKRASVVLANGSVKAKGDDQNERARERLSGVVNVYDRMVAPRSLGHNKFLVLCDGNGKPETVWTGSTNWTKTGLCTQANNSIQFDNPKVAAAYFEQWKRLKAAGDGFPEALVEANAEPKKFKLGSAAMTLWFTRTTEEQDLDHARELINGAKQGILFLMFNPGPAGTLLNAIIERGSKMAPTYDPDLYVQGVANQDPGGSKNPVILVHRGEARQAPFDIVLPGNIDKRLPYWREEIRKKYRANAMVHSKVVLVDPFGSHPVVMTGSHNLGPKASRVNDENFVIIENQPALAAAYAVNIISIYNQYRWRYRMHQGETTKQYLGLHDSEGWLRSYLDGEKAAENAFWMGSGPT